MALPSFICTGFQKSGTTTLFAILKQHPDVALCRDVKEPMYYRIPVVWRIGGRRYYEARYFGHIEPGDTRTLGEVNAGLNFTHCARKVSRDIPRGTKLIFMMRNPVDRSYSAYRYFIARGFLPREDVRYDLEHGHAAGFDHYVHEVLNDAEQRGDIMRKRLKYLVFSQSNYATCIEEYLHYYDRKDMRFVFFEEFVADQHAACLDLYEFLGLEDREGIDYHIHANGDCDRATSAKAPKRLQIAKGFYYGFHEFIAMGYWAPGLMRRYSDFYDRLRAKSMQPDDDRSKVLPETRAYLQSYYDDEVRKLEQLAGRDLSGLWF